MIKQKIKDFFKTNVGWKIFFVLMVLLGTFIMKRLMHNSDPEFGSDNTILVAVLALSFSTIINILCYKFFVTPETDQHKKYNSYLEEKLFGELEDKEKSDSTRTDVDRDIIALMLKNSEENTEYFAISKGQVRASFRLSVVSCIVGILLLIFAVVSSLYKENLDTSIIAAISGAVAELIAATVFWVHNKSAKQLNLYYDALHENEKFLSTVTLVDKLSEDRRDDMMVEIIRSQLYSGSEIKVVETKEKGK